VNTAAEVERWMKDARGSLASAERAFQVGDFRIATQQAQLCTELSAKAVIAHFAEPAWRHDPGKQLLALVDKCQRTQRLDEQPRQNLVRLADDADEVAPWHGWSTYGREQDGVQVAAVDLCTHDVASDLLTRARRSLQAAILFAEQVVKPK